jgi:ribosomal protein S18 acetylase RimI-like enzyme
MVDALHILDNAVWWSLTADHGAFAELRGRAGRYRTDTSPFAALESFDDEAWSDLAALLGPSKHFVLFCAHLPQAVPPGWVLSWRGEGRQMVLDPARHRSDVEPMEVRTLTSRDVPEMLELVEQTQPGPFRSATIELGHFYGYFQSGRLVAMAGERLRPPGYVEISAVCTHPEFQGRGLATALTHHVASGVIGQGRTPILHVAESNEGARRVYEALGFRQRCLVDFALLESPPA